MTERDYEDDLGNGEPFIDWKLEGILFFLTQLKKMLGEPVSVFINVVWGKSKLNGSIGTRRHRYKFTKKNYSPQIKRMFLIIRLVRIWNNLPFRTVETKEYTHLTILMLF